MPVPAEAPQTAPQSEPNPDEVPREPSNSEALAEIAEALGFVPADALVLAKMATGHALRHAQPAGSGRGPGSPPDFCSAGCCTTW